jgi:2,3-bisphosphoglycerate-independent phosphoglycerate mutase
MRYFAFNNKHVILLFIDGVGIGDNEPDFNPCASSETGIFNSVPLPLGGFKVGLDANLNTDGLPQSATGQTAIYTGMNTAQLIGRHLFGFPNNPLRTLLATESLFVKLTEQGKTCRFLNAFRPLFFTSPEIFKDMRMSATTEMNRAAGLPFNTIHEIKKGRALYHDYSNRVLRDLHFKMPEFSASDAAETMLNVSHEFDLLLYEYFETDRAGHDRDLKNAIFEIHKVEKLIVEIIKRINLIDTILIVISDHGNIEDLRTKSHTRNPAFCAVWNNGDEKALLSLKSITDIYGYIMQTLNTKKSVKNS